jgi:uncharacterized Ntn-hydrolase superfamily protein
MTFSIVAWDPTAPDGREWGVAVASKFLAAASVVSWARAGAGAVATQALANVTYGPAGLELLAGGRSATESIERLTSQDDERDHRQLGVIDSDGNAATFTGTECLHWAGGRTGAGYTCQGNILTGPDVIDSMAATFESTEGDLATRLMAALYAGDRAGGDSRGRQAAGLLVVREGGGYLGDTDVAIDLRVDDHADPVPELQRLLDVHRLIFPAESALEFVDVTPQLSAELRQLLAGRGFDIGAGSGYDEDMKTALFKYVGTENLEARWTDEAQIERGVLDSLRGH